MINKPAMRRSMVVVVLALLIPFSAAGAAPMPNRSSEELTTTHRVMTETYNWLGLERANEFGVDKCTALADSRQVLEALVVMEGYYPALGNDHALLQSLNIHVSRECGGAPPQAGGGGGGVVAISTPQTGGGGGGGSVQVTTDELTWAFLIMNEEQRAVFLEQASPETEYTLRTWIAENYTDASLISSYVGAITGVVNVLPHSYENPPVWDDSLDSIYPTDPVLAFPQINSQPMSENISPTNMLEKFEKFEKFENIDTYIQ